MYKVAECLDVRVATAPQWRRERRGANPSEGWIVKTLMEFFDSHRIAKHLFKNETIEVSSADGSHDHNIDDDDPFGGHEENVAEATSAEDTIRNNFLKEAKAYQSYRRNNWIECKDKGGHRKLLDNNPLHEWPKIAEEFPMLALVAEYVLSIPASSAGAERFFSALAKIITKDRCSIKRDFAGDLVASHMRNRRAKKILGQPIPDFGDIGKEVDIEDWEEMYDSDYEHDDEHEEDPQDFELNMLDFEMVAEDEIAEGEEFMEYSAKRRRVTTDIDA